MAYDRKQWSLRNLCDALLTHGATLGITWGWRRDPAVTFNPWVLYVELPTGQVSFHSPTRGDGPDYGEGQGTEPEPCSRPTAVDEPVPPAPDRLTEADA